MVLIFTFVTTVSAAKPSKSQGPHEHITGNITASTGGVTLWLEFNAHDTYPQKGSVIYANSVGGYFEGKVNCYTRYKDQVVFAGVITSGSYTQPQFKVAIALTDPKKIRVPVGIGLTCGKESSFPATMTVDNYVLHEIPGNLPLSVIETGINGGEDATPSERAIENKWDLSGEFVAHPGYDWSGLAEESTWQYDFHIKQAMNPENSTGSIHFRTGDINVIGHVKDLKENYPYGGLRILLPLEQHNITVQNIILCFFIRKEQSGLL